MVEKSVDVSRFFTNTKKHSLFFRKDENSLDIDMVELVRNQKTLIGSYYGSASSHETFDKLIDWYLKGRLNIDELITRRYSLDEINEGFEALSRGEDGRGVIIF